jgi:hypothetical protein
LTLTPVVATERHSPFVAVRVDVVRIRDRLRCRVLLVPRLCRIRGASSPGWSPARPVGCMSPTAKYGIGKREEAIAEWGDLLGPTVDCRSLWLKLALDECVKAFAYGERGVQRRLWK